MIKPWMTIVFQSPLLTLPPDKITTEIILNKLPELELRYRRIHDIMLGVDDPNGMSPRKIWRIVPGAQGGASWKTQSFPHPDGPAVKRFFRLPGSPYNYFWLDQDEEMP